MTLDQNKKTTLCFDHAKFADSPNSVVQSEIAVQPNQNDVSSCKGKSQILPLNMVTIGNNILVGGFNPSEKY